MAREVPQVITFFIGKEEFCLDARIAKSVTRMGPVTAVPGVSGFVAGAMYYKGEILPVIDLASLGIGGKAPQPYNRLITVDYNGEMIGLAVSGIGETVKTPPQGAVFLDLAQILEQAQREAK
ncbi:MAG: chemotaxis protein CheW [Candidatus Omnitrophota bacterium]|nr:chemotaxis protein CheW [Candidatus Omnitrophota bacterium]